MNQQQVKLVEQIKLKTAGIRFKILNSPNITYKILRPAYKLSRARLLFILSGVYRNDKLTKLRYGTQVLQPNSYTVYNRYADLFTICQQYFLNANSQQSSLIAPIISKQVDQLSPYLQPKLKILSFGCATGQEVASLQYYFPEAQLVGVDINQYNLKLCRKHVGLKSSHSVHNGDQAAKNWFVNPPKPIFIHSLASEYLNSNNYSAIFCLAVLQHTANRQINNQQATQFTFTQFEQQLIQFDAKLNINGLLIIDHSDFDFRETDLADRYQILAIQNNHLKRDRPLYNKHNQRIANISNQPRVFVKLR